MADAINHITVILIFGGLILLSFVKLTNPLRINVRANRWFASFLLLYATFWLEEILNFAGVTKHSLFGLALVHGLQGATPFGFYLSVWHYTNPTFKFKNKHLLHLILPLSFIALTFIKIYEVCNDTWISILTLIIILVQALYYSIASFILIRKHQRNILQFTSNNSDYSLKWLENIIIQVIIISVVIAIYSFVVEAEQLNLFANSFLLVTVYFIAYYSLKQKEIFPISEMQREEIEFIVADKEDEASEKKKLISDGELENYKQKLRYLMDEDLLFLDNELNLVKLAEALKLSPHQLSYLINEGFKENFFGFINKYRVAKAKHLIRHPESENPTMLSVAFESGFNSKTAFNTTFKKMTGLTPSEYKNGSSAV